MQPDDVHQPQPTGDDTEKQTLGANKAAATTTNAPSPAALHPCASERGQNLAEKPPLLPNG